MRLIDKGSQVGKKLKMAAGMGISPEVSLDSAKEGTSEASKDVIAGKEHIMPELKVGDTVRTACGWRAVVRSVTFNNSEVHVVYDFSGLVNIKAGCGRQATEEREEFVPGDIVTIEGVDGNFVLIDTECIPSKDMFLCEKIGNAGVCHFLLRKHCKKVVEKSEPERWTPKKGDLVSIANKDGLFCVTKDMYATGMVYCKLHGGEKEIYEHANNLARMRLRPYTIRELDAECSRRIGIGLLVRMRDDHIGVCRLDAWNEFLEEVHFSRAGTMGLELAMERFTWHDGQPFGIVEPWTDKEVV